MFPTSCGSKRSSNRPPLTASPRARMPLGIYEIASSMQRGLPVRQTPSIMTSASAPLPWISTAANSEYMLVNMTGYLTWPADFPADCPPGEAADADGIYYRIAKNDPPEPSDFESLYHVDYDRAEQAVSRGKTTCETMGLSVYTEMDHAIQCAGKYRNLGKKIVQLNLTQGSGRAALTSGTFDSHHTLWVPEGFDPVQHSQVIHSL